MERKSNNLNGTFKMKSPIKLVDVEARQNGNGSNRIGKVDSNSEGNTDLKNGRSKSSTFQKLVGNQGKLDKNKDNKISKADFDMMNSKSPLEMYGKKSAPVRNYKKGYYGA